MCSCLQKSPRKLFRTSGKKTLGQISAASPKSERVLDCMAKHATPSIPILTHNLHHGYGLPKCPKALHSRSANIQRASYLQVIGSLPSATTAIVKKMAIHERGSSSVYESQDRRHR